jgi:hypothetical protein
MERKCQYRNCEKDISHMRKDAKYCCRLHKVYEKRKRFLENKSKKDEREHE